MLYLANIDCKYKECRDLVSEFIIRDLLGYNENTKIYSIYNRERFASLCFYRDKESGFLRFKDFSSGKHGDGVTFLSDLIRKDRTNRIKSLLFISAKDKLIETEGNQKRITSVICETFLDKVLEYRDNHRRIKTGISIVSDSRETDTVYTIEDSNLAFERYFSSYRIGTEELKQNGIYPVKNVYINGSPFPDAPSDFIVGYFNPHGRLVQVYIPSEATRDGTKRFRTLVRKHNAILTYPLITNLKDETLHIYITGAIKDGISLFSFLRRNTHSNAMVVSILSERSEDMSLVRYAIYRTLSERHNLLCVKRLRFYIFFDFDKHGLEHTRRITESHPQSVPVSILLADLLTPDIKDFSDLVKKYDDTTLKNLIYERCKDCIL